MVCDMNDVIFFDPVDALITNLNDQLNKIVCRSIIKFKSDYALKINDKQLMRHIYHHLNVTNQYNGLIKYGISSEINGNFT